MTDTPRPGEPPRAPNPQARPSLTGRESSTESISILSAVNPPRRPEPSPVVPAGVSSALPWIGVLTLVVIGVIFWIELSGARTPAAAPSPVIATASPPQATPAEVATIESEHPVAAIESPQSAPTEASAVTANTPGTVTPTPPTQLARPDALAATGKTPRANAEVASAQRSPFAAMDTPAPRKPKPRPAAPATVAAPTGNADVDLLQALLSVAPQNNGAAAPATRAPKPVAEVPAAVTRKQPSRDVVERDPVESTATLLKRCDRLGVLEAVLCKARICSGLWGRDSACPATNDPAYKKG